MTVRLQLHYFAVDPFLFSGVSRGHRRHWGLARNPSSNNNLSLYVSAEKDDREPLHMCSKWEMSRRATTCPFPKTQHFSSKFTSSSLIPPGGSRLNDGTAAPPDNQLPHPHPHLTHHWWNRRVAREICDTFIRKRNGVTCELRMEVTLMEEIGVDQWHQERVAEHKRAEENTREDDQLGDGHNAHGSVVVSWITCHSQS